VELLAARFAFIHASAGSAEAVFAGASPTCGHLGFIHITSGVFHPTSLGQPLKAITTILVYALNPAQNQADVFCVSFKALYSKMLENAPF
ncbi:MAG: hypothetical protein ACUVQM_06405, partial [Candidatus Hadarchaeaceae archaeon]